MPKDKSIKATTVSGEKITLKPPSETLFQGLPKPKAKKSKKKRAKKKKAKTAAKPKK